MRCSFCTNSLFKIFNVIYNSKQFCSEKCVESSKNKVIEPCMGVKKCHTCKYGIHLDRPVYMFANKEYCSEKCRGFTV
jgi:hypothetical protein